MRRNPFKQYLNIDGPSDPFTLLGLSPGRYDAADIEAALRHRLSMVFTRGSRANGDAEVVRSALRAAAARLKDPTDSARLFEAMTNPTRPTRELAAAGAAGPPNGAARSSNGRPGFVPQLTEFDRLVLGVLVGSGGWNASSRARLVGLASAHGISVQGLLKVIRGLSAHASHGGARLGVAEITSGASMRFVPAAASTQASPEVQRAIEAASAHEHPRDAAWAHIKWSAAFGVLTIIGGVILLRLVTGQPSQSPPSPSREAVARAAAPLTGSNPGEPAPRRARALQFPQLPSFVGNGLPTEGTSAADAAPGLAAEFDLIQRRLSITDEPAESVYRSWDVSIDTIATGWVLTDGATQRDVRAAIIQVLLEAADTPTVADRLLRSIAPSSLRASEPLSIWRGSWRAGMLAEVVGARTLPPFIVQQARSLFSEIILGSSEAMTFDAAAQAWLRQGIPPLVEATEVVPVAYDTWELWLSAARQSARGTDLDATLLAAIQRFLESRTDISRPGPSQNIVGRLLSAANFSDSPETRRRLIAMFDTEDVPTHSMWVVTSILSRYDIAPWFGDRLVLGGDADWLMRRRVRDLISAAWPTTAAPSTAHHVAEGSMIVIDASAGARWMRLQAQVMTLEVEGTAEPVLRQLVAVARLNQAAGELAAQRPLAAIRAMDEAERLMQPGAAPLGGDAPPKGQAIGRDGQWAEAYRAAMRSSDQKLQTMRSLRSTAGSDLGPIDAEAFVHEVYHGTPSEIRSQAEAMVIEIFLRGPNVMLELLDQLPGVAASERVSDTIRRITGADIPSTRSSDWRERARLALIGHVLEVQRGGESATDRWVDELIDSIVARTAAQRNDGSISMMGSAAEAAQRLVEAWRNRAGVLIAVEPVPADMAGLARRDLSRQRLAQGPLQQFAAHLITALEYLAYIASAEQPARVDDVAKILGESARERGRRTHVLQQALDADRAASSLWRLRFQIRGEEARQ